MPSQEEIDNQLERLKNHRYTLAGFLTQQALLSVAYTPPGVANGIRAARDEIRRIKAVLRSWGVSVEDYPDDDEPLTWQPAQNEAAPSMSYSDPFTQYEIGLQRLLERLGSDHNL